MSTVRAFINKKRVSTGRLMKNGSFFQAYPTHRVFPNEVEWMHHWKMSSNDDVSFVEEGYEDMPPLIPASAPKPSTAAQVAPKQHSTPAPAAPVREKRCCVCAGPIGQDHRMCIAMMYRSGIPDAVNEWHRLSGFNDPPRTPASSPAASPPPAAPSTPPTKPTPSSPPPLTRKSSAKPSLDDWTYRKEYTFVAPPGTYYIGDICYFLKDPIYDGIFGGHGYESGHYTQKSDGAFFVVDGTAYGDGEYRGTDGFAYGVDAGIIGIVSRSLGPEEDEKVYGGKLHTFRDPVEIKFGNGMFRFHSRSKYLAIDTAGNTYNSDEDW